MKKILLLLVVVYSIESLPTLAQDGEPLPLYDGSRAVKLSPQVRVLEREKRISTIRIDVIQQFLDRPKLVTPEEIEEAGYIITNTEQSIFSTKGSQIYVKGIYGAPVGSKYIIVRLGKIYYSPLKDEEEEVLGHEAVFLGEAKLQSPGNLATFIITSAVREIKAKDLLLPLTERVIRDDFYPHSPSILEDAYVIAVTSNVVLIGRYHIVVINKGSDDGIERGHVLAVFNKPGLLKDAVDSEDDDENTLPKLPVGSLLVFKVFEQVSYALVTESKVPIHLLDIVTVP